MIALRLDSRAHTADRRRSTTDMRTRMATGVTINPGRYTREPTATAAPVRAATHFSSRSPSRVPVGTALTMLIAGALSGCAAHGAPSFVLFGAYFPVWMLVAAIGILAAAVARLAFVTTGLADVLPFQLLTCTSIGVTTATLVWLIGFAQ